MRRFRIKYQLYVSIFVRKYILHDIISSVNIAFFNTFALLVDGSFHLKTNTKQAIIFKQDLSTTIYR